MNSAYATSIARAKNLYDGFYDVIHNWEHSERVATNARLIADAIGYEGDKDFLELCALWHDAARTQGFTDGHEEEGALMAKQDLIQHGVDKETAERVYTAIRFHKSSSNPTTTEGKIIRDADKLDIFTVARWENCAKAGWIKEYVDDLRKTVAAHRKYPDAFTYDFTKEQFAQKLPEFLSYYESVKDSLPE
jgi:HD superfamily phosphodiesterase